MANLAEMIRDYCKPPEVEDLFQELFDTYSREGASNQDPILERVKERVRKRYELRGIPPMRLLKLVGAPPLEEKIDNLKTAYSWQAALCLGAPLLGSACYLGAMMLGSSNPDLQPELSEGIGLYVAGVVGLPLLVHGIRSAYALVETNYLGRLVGVFEEKKDVRRDRSIN